MKLVAPLGRPLVHGARSERVRQKSGTHRQPASGEEDGCHHQGRSPTAESAPSERHRPEP
jgi:hypothetical protein